jgi:hypothetical protein
MQNVLLTNTVTAAAPVCPRCKTAIRSDDINVATDIALCRVCNIPHKFSALISNANLEASVDLQHPPHGTWYQSSHLQTVIGASHRSLGAALGLLAISLFWNGIVSVFVLLAISGTLANLGVHTPEWFPAPKMNGGPMSIGMTIFLWIFLTPFIAIGAAMLAGFVSSLGGRTEIRLRDPSGIIFSGIGPVGRTKRFLLADVSDVRLLDQTWRDSDGDSRNKKTIILERKDGKQIKFGSMLTDDRKKFVAAALRKSVYSASGRG